MAVGPGEVRDPSFEASGGDDLFSEFFPFKRVGEKN